MSSIFLFIINLILFNVFNPCSASAPACEQGDLCSLTIEQKVGQLFIVGFGGAVMSPELEQEIRDLHPGGVLLLGKNIESEEQLKKLISDLRGIAMDDTGLPLLIAVDQEGGELSRIDFLKEKTAPKDIHTKKQAYGVGQTRGSELKDLGVNLNLAPLLDEAEKSDFIYSRSLLRNDLIEELVKGQKDSGILTCIKHFPGYEGISFNPEEELAFRDELPRTERFKNTEAEFVMTANVVYRELGGLPFTFLKKGIDLIKKELGSSVLIITDDLDQYSLLNNYSLEDIVVKPVQAGVDMLIFSGWRLPEEDGVEILLSAVKRGDVDEGLIDRAVERIIKVKEKLK